MAGRTTRRYTIPVTSNQTEFYRARAAEARARSDEAVLHNVKENHLRAAEAWDVLANRSDKSDRLRAADALRKSEQLAAEG